MYAKFHRSRPRNKESEGSLFAFQILSKNLSFVFESQSGKTRQSQSNCLLLLNNQ